MINNLLMAWILYYNIIKYPKRDINYEIRLIDRRIGLGLFDLF